MPGKRKRLRLLRPHHLAYLKALAGAALGLTDLELAGILGKPATCVRGRRAELAHLGLCEATETYRTTPSGRRSRVWQITGTGRLKLNEQEKQP